MQFKPRMTREPASNDWMLTGGEIIENDVMRGSMEFTTIR